MSSLVAVTAVRREIENRFIEVSFDVAPELDFPERVAFVNEMMATLSDDDVDAILLT